MAPTLPPFGRRRCAYFVQAPASVVRRRRGGPAAAVEEDGHGRPTHFLSSARGSAAGPTDAQAWASHAERRGRGAGIVPAMNGQSRQALVDLRPMIKTCWEVLLRAEPPRSALGNPDTLVFMMDRTLDAFFEALGSPGARRWLAKYPLLCETLETSCPCMRNPLLPYYVSGEQALLAVAAEALPEATSKAREALLEEVRVAYHYHAQRELQNFCDLCRAGCRRSMAGLVAGRRRGPPAQPRRVPALVR